MGRYRRTCRHAHASPITHSTTTIATPHQVMIRSSTSSLPAVPPAIVLAKLVKEFVIALHVFAA